jgi:O-antigen/teichoic acid export membrane protein
MTEISSHKNSLTTQFAHGAFWIFIGNIVSRLGSFLVAVIIARILGKTGFGEFAIIQSTIYLFGSVT